MVIERAIQKGSIQIGYKKEAKKWYKRMKQRDLEHQLLLVQSCNLK